MLSGRHNLRRNVADDFEEAGWLAGAVALKGPPRGDDQFMAVAGSMNELAYPVTFELELFQDFGKRIGETGLEKLVGDLTECFVPLPAVHLFRAAIPEGN